MDKTEHQLPQTTELAALLADQVPLIDVRAPIEYNLGSFPHSVNLPLMSDEERHLVGICYKEKGHHAALLLGHQLVSGEIKEARIRAWAESITQHPQAHIMCFRGGMRSKISQSWLTEHIGRPVPRVFGGYKALRNLAISLLDNPFSEIPAFIIGGHTGAGKTPFLKQLDKLLPGAGAIDLEGLAKHRGSAFGGLIEAQPPQATFENTLAQQLLVKKREGARAYFFENESRAIGRVMLPQTFMNHLQQLPLLVLDSPLSDRIERTWQEYVVEAIPIYCAHFGEDLGRHNWAQDLRERLGRIQKRLGLERYQSVLAIYENALLQPDLHAHRAWIEVLLSSYYDPMYAYQRDKWESKVQYEGNAAALTEYIKSLIK